MTLFKMTNEFSICNELSAYEVKYILYKTSENYWYIVSMDDIKLGIDRSIAGYFNKQLKNIHLLIPVCNFNDYSELLAKCPELFI